MRICVKIMIIERWSTKREKKKKITVIAWNNCAQSLKAIVCIRRIEVMRQAGSSFAHWCMESWTGKSPRENNVGWIYVWQFCTETAITYISKTGAECACMYFLWFCITVEHQHAGMIVCNLGGNTCGWTNVQFTQYLFTALQTQVVHSFFFCFPKIISGWRHGIVSISICLGPTIDTRRIGTIILHRTGGIRPGFC